MARGDVRAHRTQHSGDTCAGALHGRPHRATRSRSRGHCARVCACFGHARPAGASCASPTLGRRPMASRSSRCRCAERASRSTPRFARSQLHAASRRSAAFRTRPRNTAMPVRRPHTRSAVRARQPRIIDRLASKLGGGWRRRIDPARLFAAAERDAQAFVFASDGSTVGFEENYTDALDCYRLAIEVRWRHGARVSTWKGADPPPPWSASVQTSDDGPGCSCTSAWASSRRQWTCTTSWPACSTCVRVWAPPLALSPRGGRRAPNRLAPRPDHNAQRSSARQTLARHDEAVASWRACLTLQTRAHAGVLLRTHTLKTILSELLVLRTPAQPC